MLHIISVTDILLFIAQGLWYFQISGKQITEIHMILIMKEFLFTVMYAS